MRNMMLQERNFNKLLLTALLIGAVGTAFAGIPCGTNLEYELDGTTLVLTSPDPTQAATIAAQAFCNSEMSFKDVLIPDNVTEINTRAFEYCTGLLTVVIPPSVTLVGEHAFYGCSSLMSVLCRPTSAPTLGSDAFTGCHTSLEICVPKLGGTDGYRSSNWNTSYGDKLKLCFLDENDEQTATAGQISYFREQTTPAVFLFRTLRKAGCFNTLTLPFNVPDIASSPLAGAEVYEFVGATVVENALQLDITPLVGSSLTAGTPYLIQWPNTGEVLTRMLFMDITWDDDQTALTAESADVNYVGFYGKTHISYDANHSNLFLGGNNTLYWPTDGENEDAKMLGFRAYFHVTTGGSSLSPVRKGMPAFLRIKSTPTDVESSQSSEISIQKVLEDGNIIIIRNGEKFSINGQKL